MAYQVLARKWRPRTFASLVGQEHVVRALTHALEQQRLHHAYLFTGTRGVGKTTIARILAKSLNCETGITPTPCGTCSACTEIDAGRFIDLLEVDAATNTKVDEMRQLLENAVYAPTRGRFKVYVIDEVHMLSNSAFNAMLKTLEEPPEHIKFILATTDPQKIPVTVLSRCLQFNLKQMPQISITQHLGYIAGEEQIEAEPAALALLAQGAHGSMRDALSLMDQAIAFAAGPVTEADVRAMLGTVDRGYLFNLLERLAASDVQGMLDVSAEMEARSVSFDNALQELGALLHRIALSQASEAALAAETPERGRIVALAAAIDPETVQLLYQIVIHGRQDLPLAPDEAAGFNMTLIRMAVFRTADSPDAATAPAAPPRARPAMPAAPARPAPGSPPRAAPQASPSAPQAASRPQSTVPQSASGESPVGALPDGAAEFDGDWPALVRELKVTGVAKQLAERSALLRFERNAFDLRIPPAAKHLSEKSFQEKLKSALEARFGVMIRLTIDVADVPMDAPVTVASQEAARRDSELKRAEATIEDDPFMRELVQKFDAKIDSIKPL